MLNPLHDLPANDYAIATLQEDVERVRAAREAIGRRVGFAIAGDKTWTPPIALRYMPQVEDLDTARVEEPLATEDREGSAEAARRLDTPVAG